MPYRAMAGDYYMGDYYRGDPFLGFIGKAISGIGRVLGFGGGPSAKAIAGQVVKALPPAVVSPGISMAGRAGAIMRQAGATIVAHPGISAAGGAAAAAGVASLATRAAMMPAVSGMRGFHMSKPHRGGAAPHMVRNRRMRVTNTKALHRSLRRIGGFARVARRVLRFTSPKAARGRPQFRFKRKASR